MQVITKVVKFCIILFAHFFIFSQQASAGRSVAIVIGVGDYHTSSGLQKLQSHNDAKRVTKALRRLGWEVHMLTSDGIATQKPTRENISSLLNIGFGHHNQLGKFDHNDILMFYYSGHGVSDSATSTNFIIPIDAKRNGVKFNQKSLISVSKIDEALRALNPGRLFFVVDACRNSALTAKADLRRSSSPKWKLGVKGIRLGDPSGKRFDRFANLTKGYYIFASSPGAFAHEIRDPDAAGGIGIFTYHLISAMTWRGIRDADTYKERRKRGCVTAHELFKYTRKHTEATALEFGKEQIPESRSVGWGERDRYCLLQYVGAGRPLECDPQFDTDCDDKNAGDTPSSTRNNTRRHKVRVFAQPSNHLMQGNFSVKIGKKRGRIITSGSFSARVRSGAHRVTVTGQIRGPIMTPIGPRPGPWVGIGCSDTFDVSEDIDLKIGARLQGGGSCEILEQ